MKKSIYLLMAFAAFVLAPGCTPEELAEETQMETIDDTASDLETDPSEAAGDETSDEPTGETPAAGEEGTANEETGQGSCSPDDFIFVEESGVVLAEMEGVTPYASWQILDSEPESNGEGYLVWTGSQYFGSPGQGLISLKIRIQQTGTYRFSWRSAVTNGNEGTEHNDTWLRFPDASDFYGDKSSGVVYPAGSGKSPNPNGSSSEGWFKIYRSGSDLGFKWQAYTSDHDPHNIYVRFDTPGVYTMEISARSSGHAIDRFALVRTGLDFEQAVSGNPTPVSCGG